MTAWIDQRPLVHELPNSTVIVDGRSSKVAISVDKDTFSI